MLNAEVKTSTFTSAFDIQHSALFALCFGGTKMSTAPTARRS